MLPVGKKSSLFYFIWSLQDHWCLCFYEVSTVAVQIKIVLHDLNFLLFIFFYESTVWNKDLWSEELSFNHCEWSSPRIRSLYIKGFNCWSASVSVSKTQMIWSSCWNRNLKMTLQRNSLFCSSSYCGGAEVRVLNVIISINVWNKTSSAVYWRSLDLFVFCCLPSIKKEKK